MALVVPRNPIEAAQEMQWGIDMSSPDDAPRLARDALDVLGDVRTIYGSRKLLIGTLGAYVLDRGRTLEEMFEQQFSDVYVKGFFSGIFYVQGGSDPYIQSLVVDLVDVQLLGSNTSDEVAAGRIAAPLTIPVGDIQTVLVAA